VPNRHASSEYYRYGFGGQEKDDELKGEGNSLNYTYRMHDPRVGRFFAVDPLSSKYPWYSPYQFAGNKVILYGELEGLEETAFTMSLDKKFGSSSYLNRSTAQRNEERKVQATVAVLMITTLVDIYVTKGWLSRTVFSAGLLESINETERGYEAHDKGNEAEAQRRFKNAGEASKVALLGVLAEGAGFALGQLFKSSNLGKVVLEDSNVVNKSFKDAGYFPPYKPNVTLGLIKTSKEVENLVRLSSNSNSVEGVWFTTAKEVEGLTTAQLKDKFSLKFEPTSITLVSIKAGSTIRVGEAAAIKEFKTNGGGFQIEVIDGGATYGTTKAIKR
jgi:RHS repeat-associated protein